MDPTTGTLQVRGVSPDPYQRVARAVARPVCEDPLFVGPPYNALLVNDSAIGRDQGQTLVYVVTSDNVVQYRNVVLGELHEGLRVITEGLESGERIVVRGLQRVQPGMKVRSTVVNMPLPPRQAARKAAGSSNVPSDVPKNEPSNAPAGGKLAGWATASQAQSLPMGQGG